MANDYAQGGAAWNRVVGAKGVRTRPVVKTGGFKTKRLEIEFADNGGYMMTCYHEAVRTGGDGPTPYKEPTKKVYENKEGLIKGIGAYL